MPYLFWMKEICCLKVSPKQGLKQRNHKIKFRCDYFKAIKTYIKIQEIF